MMICPHCGLRQITLAHDSPACAGCGRQLLGGAPAPPEPIGLKETQAEIPAVGVVPAPPIRVAPSLLFTSEDDRGGESPERAPEALDETPIAGISLPDAIVLPDSDDGRGGLDLDVTPPEATRVPEGLPAAARPLAPKTGPPAPLPAEVIPIDTGESSESQVAAVFPEVSTASGGWQAPSRQRSPGEPDPLEPARRPGSSGVNPSEVPLERARRPSSSGVNPSEVPHLSVPPSSGSQPARVGAPPSSSSRAVRRRSSSGASSAAGRAIPDRIGRYVIDRELGRGGMGVVYKAFDTSLHRHVAIKMVRGNVAGGDAEEVDRFMREARLAAKLRHAGIVSVYEAGQFEDDLFIVMDHVEGESLERRLSRAPMAHRHLAEAVQEIAHALAHAHEQGVVHRDIKPQNVLIDTDGRARLTDFGLARDTKATIRQITVTGEVVGTPSYMAPEQASGDDPIPRPTIDIWALGAILYRGLVGRPPFEGANALATIQLVIDGEPAPPRSVDPSISVELETIAMHCLEKDARHRYQSAAEVAEELRRFLAGEAIVARPVRRRDRAARWARRNRAFAATIAFAILLVAALLVAGAAFVAYSYEEIGRALEIARRERREAQHESLRARAAEEMTRAEAARAAEARLEAEAARAEAERVGAEAELARIDAERHLALALFERAGRMEGEGREQEAWATLAHVVELRDTPGARLRLARVRGRAPWLRFTTSSRPEGKVWSVAFAPGGGRLATAAAGGVSIWDLTSGREVERLATDAAVVHAIAFTPDGHTIATASQTENEVVLWDAATGERRLVLIGHAQGVIDLAITADGRTLASASRDATVRLWDLGTGALTGTLVGHEGWVHAVAFSPDGANVASAGQDGSVRLWDRVSASLTETLAGHAGAVNAVAFGPAGRLLVSGGADGTVRLWDPGVPVQLGVLGEPGGGAVHSLRLDPSGRRLAVGTLDGSVSLWDVAAETRARTFAGHQGPVVALDFDAQGERLASGGDDGSVRIWALGLPEEIASLGGHRGEVLRVAPSPTGDVFASAGADGSVRVWRLATGQPKDAVAAGAVAALAWSPRGERVAWVTQQGEALEWRPGEGAPGRLLPPQDAPCRAAAFDADLRTVALGVGPDLRIVDLATARESHARMLHGGQPISTLGFGPRGRFVATGAADGSVRVWDRREGKPVAAPAGHQGAVARIAFSPDGARIATAGADRTVCVFRVADGRRLLSLAAQHGRVRSLCFDGRGETLATGADDGTVTVFDASTGERLTTIVGGKRAVTDVHLDAAGRMLLAAHADGSIRRWDLPDDAPAAAIEAHRGGVRALAFAGGSRRLASGGGEGTIRVVDLDDPDGAAVVLAGHGGAVDCLAFGADRRTIVSGGADGRLAVWDARAGRERRDLVGHTGRVLGVGLLEPDGTISTVGLDAPGRPTARLWRPDGGEQARTPLPGPDAERPVAALSSDGRALAWLQRDGAIVLLDVAAGRETARLSGPLDAARCAAFGPARERLVVGGGRSGPAGGGVVRLWDLEQGRVRWSQVERTEVGAVAIDPGAAIVAIGTADGSVRLRDGASGEELSVLEGHRGAVAALAFSPDGRALLSGGADGTIRVWDLSVLPASVEALGAEADRATGLAVDGFAARALPGNRLLLSSPR